MDYQVRAVLWLAAFSVISHGAEAQCRFCFKYFLESCDGTYRVEIGNIALSEEDLRFTKHCSNEPLKNGLGILGGSFAISSEISGNNFPIVSGKIPDQHPDYGIVDSVGEGSHQEINTDAGNTVPQQQYPNVQSGKRPIHVKDGSTEFSVHHVNVKGENTVYQFQYPDSFKSDQDSGSSGERSVETGPQNVINAVHQSKYIEGFNPAQNPSFDGEESVGTSMDNVKINIGDNTNYQHLSPEDISFSNDNEGLEGTLMHPVIIPKSKESKRQPVYSENLSSDQYSSLGGKGSEEIGIQHAVNVEGENTVYQPQLLDGLKPYQYLSNGGEELVGTGVQNSDEASFLTGMHNIINHTGEKIVYKPQYPEDSQPSQQPIYDGDGLLVTGIHNVINKVGENTNDQPQYSEELKPSQYPNNGAEIVELGMHDLINKQGEHIIHQPQNLEGIQPGTQPGYGGEKLVGLGMHNVINNDGENTIYQSQYPKGFRPGQYPIYDREGSVETGIFSEINKVGENTNYIPQYSEGFKPNQHPSSGREGTVQIGLHNVKNVEGENLIYQPQYPKVFKPRQYPNYVGEGSVESGIHNGINKEVENPYYTVYQQKYSEEFKPSQQDFPMGLYPSYVREGNVGIGTQHAINAEGKNTVYQPSYPKSFQSGEFSSHIGAGPVVNEMHFQINPNGKNTVYQPQFPENFQPGQFPSNGRTGSVQNGIHYLINNEGENTIYQPQYPGGIRPGQDVSYGGEELVGTGMIKLRKPKYENSVSQQYYPEYFQPGQNPSNGAEGAMGIEMHNETNIESEHTIYQSLYPEVSKHDQQLNTANNPQNPMFFQPGQNPGFGSEGSVGIETHHVTNVDGENTVYQPQFPESSISSNEGIGSTGTGLFNAINIEGDNTIYESQYPKGFRPGQQTSYGGQGSVVTEINNLHQYPHDFQPGQLPSFSMHNEINTEGEHTIYQPVYPEDAQHSQQSSGIESIKIEISNLKYPKDKQTVNEPQFSEDFHPGQNSAYGEVGSVESGIHNVLNQIEEQTDNQVEHPENLQSDQQPGNGVEISVGNGIHVLIDSEGKNTLHRPEYPEISLPNSNFDEKVSVGIEMSDYKNPKDKKSVNELQFLQSDQHPAHEGEESMEFGIHNVLNPEREHTDNLGQLPEDLQPEQHPDNGVDVSIGNGMHVLIDSKDKNTLHEPQYPEIFLPDPSFGGKVSLGIEMSNLKNPNDKKTVNEFQFPENFQPSQNLAHEEEESAMHNVLNIEREHIDSQAQHPGDLQPNPHPSNGEKVSLERLMHVLTDSTEKNTLHEPQYPEIVLPDSSFDGKESIEIGDQHAINVEDKNTVYLPHSPEVFKPDQYPNSGGEGTVEIGINHGINTEGVNSIYQPQSSEGSQPDTFIGFGNEESLQTGINNVKNTIGVNNVHKLQYSDSSIPNQLPIQGAVGSVETGSRQVGNIVVENTVQQPVYPIAIQPDQHPSYDGVGSVELGNENIINVVDNNAGYDGESSDVEKSVHQPEHSSVALLGQHPIFSGEGSADVNSHHITNVKGEKTVFLSEYPEGVQSDQISSFGETGSAETGMHDAINFKAQNAIHHLDYPKNLQLGVHPTYGGDGASENLVQNNLRVVHSGVQSEYPDHLHEYQSGDVPIKMGTEQMQKSNYQSGVSGHQSSYPNEKQSGQLVEKSSSGVEQPQHGNAEYDQIGSHEIEIEVNHVSYPGANSNNNMQSGGHIPGSGNIESLRKPGYPYLGIKETPGLYQNVLFEPQALSGLQHLRERVPLRGILQYLQIPSRQKVVQHIVHHHVHMPTFTAGLSGMPTIIEKQKLVECLKKYGKVCKKLLKNKFHIPEDMWYKYYNKYGRSSHQNPMKDLYVDESARNKLLYSQLYGLYGKQLSPYMKHIPKLEQSSSSESSEQFDENSENAIQLQALLAGKKEEGKYPYAPAYMRPYIPQINHESSQSMSSADLFGNIPDFKPQLKSEKSAKQIEIKSSNDFTPGDSTKGTSSPGKIYHKIIKKIRVRTRSKIRGRMSRRNNNEGTEDYEDENTTDDPNESVEYVEVEVPEDNDEEKNKNADLVESVAKPDVPAEGTVGEELH